VLLALFWADSLLVALTGLAVASGLHTISHAIDRQLIAHGHEVLGLTRDPGSRASPGGARRHPGDRRRSRRDGLLRAVNGLRADAVVHELTALRKPPRGHRGMALTNRLRTEGTACATACCTAATPPGRGPCWPGGA
jgi:nucleoside-diphosphate-sugar epimerase